jgi:hypothetical protein
VTAAAGLDFSRIEELRSGPGASDVLVEATAGPIDVSAVQTGVETSADNLMLDATGEIRLGRLLPGGPVVLQGANITLTSQTSIVSRDNDLHLQVNGNGLLTLNAFGLLGDSTNYLRFESPRLQTMSFGSQWLSSNSSTRIETAIAAFPIPGMLVPTGTITLHSGNFLLDPPGGLPVGQPGVLATQVFVDSGVLLGGSGSVGSVLVVRSGGTVDMGFADGATGRLQVFGNLAFLPGSNLIADINAPYAVPGVDYDQLIVTGNLLLGGGALQLRGAEQLRVTINEVVLIDVQSLTPPLMSGFLIDGTTLVQDGPFIRARVGQFRGKLFFNGGNGNDVVLSELSLSPPIQNPAFRLPPLRLPVFSPTERIIPPIAPPPPAIPPTVDPVVEAEAEPLALRFVEVRIVIPLDDAGNTREEVVLKLSAEWLERLPMILRRLPDDRYRIYLMLDGGSEQRLVIDVLVRAGRPVEPGDLQMESSAELQFGKTPTPGPVSGDRTDASDSSNAPRPSPPDANASPTPLLLDPAGREQGSISPRPSGSQRFAITSAAVAAVIAARSQARPQSDMATLAGVIGERRNVPHGRWWRRGAARTARSGNSQGGES